MADRRQSEFRLADRLALSVAEAAKALGISERHMRTIIPEIPCCYVGARRLIPVSLLEEWLRERAQREQSVVGKAVDEILGKIRSNQ